MKKLVLVILVAACGGGGGSNVETPTGAFFPGQTPYNRDISGVTPVSNSDAITQFMEGAHPPNGWGTGQMQIDFALIVNQAPSGTEKKTFTIEPDYYYPPECDDAPFPLPSGGAVEVDWQAPAPLGGLGGYDCSGYDNGDDCHILVNDPSDHRLYELYHATVRSDGTFMGGCEAIWDTSTAPTDMGRGEQCTSADAAGYAIAPLLVTPDEVFAGHVDHAVRLILPNDMIRGGTYFSPATHGTGSSGPDPDSLPYGGRMRLKADYPIDQLDPAAQVVATAMQKYGLMLADGGNIAITMSNDELSAHTWDEVGLAPDSLSALKATDFDVILDGDAYVTEATDCTRTQITN